MTNASPHQEQYRQARYAEKLILEYEGEPTHTTDRDTEYENFLRKEMPGAILRNEPPHIPSLPEYIVARHYTRLAEMNYGITSGFYPLGSCTMKYNPTVLEEVARWRWVADIHPLQPENTVEGALQVMKELGIMLAEISGMDAVSLQPAAGAHGEYTGMAIVRKYFEDMGQDRNEVIIPDTAHGTNPASAAMAGFDVIEIKSKKGYVDIDALKSVLSTRTAAFMLTNPNTLGLFESDVLKIEKIVHEAGALLYYDGANLNAIMGITNPRAMGFDIVHFNLHKTFATPHGGGGPGSGPIGTIERLAKYLPLPKVVRTEQGFKLEHSLSRITNGGCLEEKGGNDETIGSVHTFHGNFIVLLKSYAYIRLMGRDGLKKAAERAVLNANYLKKKVEKILDVPYGEIVKHEFVASCAKLKKYGIRAKDVAKRLLDYGFHPPTIYFPLIVDEALMIEPTETENKETLDAFSDALQRVIEESIKNTEFVKNAPQNTAVSRVDEVLAAREPILNYRRRKNEK